MNYSYTPVYKPFEPFKKSLAKNKSKWVEIEQKWLDAYKRNEAIDGFSAVHNVSGSDEWLCEAYMKTDYSKLTEQDFQTTINDYLAYLVKEGFVYESSN